MAATGGNEKSITMNVSMVSSCERRAASLWLCVATVCIRGMRSSNGQSRGRPTAAAIEFRIYTSGETISKLVPCFGLACSIEIIIFSEKCEWYVDNNRSTNRLRFVDFFSFWRICFF